jgi:hypothetical protein
MYLYELSCFLKYFENHELKNITKEQIEAFVYHMVSKHKISESKQNGLINALQNHEVLRHFAHHLFGGTADERSDKPSHNGYPQQRRLYIYKRCKGKRAGNAGVRNQ